MSILIISDIHANLAAFEAVLADAAGQWDTIWHLGDLVGYGPNPNECVNLLRQHDHISLSGNHDWAVLGRLDINSFNEEAQFAAQWTQSVLNEDVHAYLESLPTTLIKDSFTLAHASPRQPVWEYILDGYTAAINFEYFDTPYCLVGHTHVPVVFSKEGARIVPRRPSGRVPILLNDTRCIINPGSVGQPRDSDPRAAYALLDLENQIWEYRRVEYPVAQTQAQMREIGMPDKLANRLEHGW
ncbi:MAG: metallophosphoesterase family protein [Chloroflexi bacterium]|nr:metallophosphoesterase family protein [Chloroflexota bacterium]